MNPNTRNRILIIAMMLFPLIVMALFWLFGNEPKDPAATLPVMPPR